MLKRNTAPVVAFALGYATTARLERFTGIIDARTPEDAARWDLRQQRFWVDKNRRVLPDGPAEEYLEISRARGRNRRELELWRAWRRLISEMDWTQVSPWGPGIRPIGQTWRLERLQLLYLITESIALAEAEVMSQVFLLGRDPYLAAAPLALIADSGRLETERLLFSLAGFFDKRYGSSPLNA